MLKFNTQAELQSVTSLNVRQLVPVAHTGPVIQIEEYSSQDVPIHGVNVIKLLFLRSTDVRQHEEIAVWHDLTLR